MEQRIYDLLLFYPVFLFSLSFHEASHGFMANKFGDSTAKMLGRITLSPFPHIDILGTVILPIIGFLTNAPIIGWGKPVPINPWNFTNAKKGTFWVSALGPLSNIFLAFMFALLAWILVLSLSKVSVAEGSFLASSFTGLYRIAQTGVVLNLVLAFFNLIPIPPLDGSGIIKGILPNRYLYEYEKIGRYGMIIIFLLLITGVLRYIMLPVRLFAGLLLPF